MPLNLLSLLLFSENVDISEISNESQRKRQLTDLDGFIYLSKFNTAKAVKALEKAKSVSKKL